MAKEFAQAVAAGQLRRGVDVDGAAIGLHAVVDGLAYHWLLDRRRFDLERVGARALDAYLGGLGAGAPAAKRRTRRPALSL
jgi:TetR/AcrR family acrAB operon transcriptional repressor